ncbi:hypothetical protein Taro_051567 [Colocasia esculenta]|uniref:Receptor-like serine/threonine-protein kinase n=1 Tax=Colocasia esculenta TaxID=4460 RepID=A0A843XH80_COLES|nr:hypothetical protein [Colocasia esculenta]
MCRLAPEARRWPALAPLAFVLLTLCNLSPLGGADTFFPDKPIRDNETLLSSGGTFRLGFFSPGGPDRRYLGIWYEMIPEQTVVWVANRENPIAGSSGVLRLDKDGNLKLYDGNRAVWSSHNSSAGLPVESRPVAQLLDNGNLVLKEENDGEDGSFLWQSFDYPTDTLLPGMKLGWDLRKGLHRYLVSWKANDDPSPGDHSFMMTLQGSPQLVLMNGSNKVYRSGPWNGVRLSGVPEMKSNGIFTFEFVSNNSEVYYTYQLRNGVVSRLMVTSSGALQRFVWLEQKWSPYWQAPKDQCDSFATCGTYGVCDSNDSQVCNCPEGFRPRSKTRWELRDGSGGCERETPLDCRPGGDDFIHRTGMKLPDATLSVTEGTMSMDACREVCLRNCSCMAYASADVRSGNGCIMWVGNLTDLRHYTEDGQDLYVRVAASVVGEKRARATGGEEGKEKTVAVIVGVTVPAGLLLLLVLGVCCLRRKMRKKTETSRVGGKEVSSGKITREDDLELPLFDIGTVAAATNNFSEENKLGEGGFGPVYKGELEEGQSVAVKRLSTRSVQGLDEFRNEVLLIAKLQHRNLVRLLGCCIEGEERILLYEYMHNKGLDSFIFDKSRSELLNWRMRFNIILGISRGLLYLHQDSRFRIIHRDLKASNILLDTEMNPKISDFGAARIFGGDKEDTGNTRKVVGTYGYMSPEYAMDGVFSVKSDVFSFGVLMIEIISGKKNKGFYYDDSYLNLLLLAWKLWKEGNCRELLDETMGNSYSPEEVMRCIQVGLLCVQERPEDRPTMSTVVLMLGGTNPALPPPQQPGYCMGRSPVHTGTSTSAGHDDSCSVNQVTVTMLEGR